MQLESRYAEIQGLLGVLPPRPGLSEAEITSCFDLAKDAMGGAGRADRAVQLLAALTELAPDAAEAWQLLGFAYREEQRMPAAADAFARAVDLRPDNALSALSHAQIRHAAGLPAVQWFLRALELAPGDHGAVRGLALALAAEAKGAAAQAVLEDALDRKPGWLEGHQCLATLRWTAGDSHDFASSYAEACRAQPRNLALRIAWFRAVAQTRDWEAARAIIADGERVIGPTHELTMARVFIAGESGERVQAEQLFAQTAAFQDPVRDMAYVRHCLRSAHLEKAESVALGWVKTPSAPMIWPYLSLIWRLRGDTRARWLDGAPPWIRTFDLDMPPADWERLALLLRQLHTAQSPYLEQSIRGGTQTGGQLFFRFDPIVQKLKTQIEFAVREYLTALPDQVPGHPLLGPARDARTLFAGSWSVRLQGSGFHVSPTHPLGWISSALYVKLPEPAQLGTAPAGWISFGTPPPDLGLQLPPYQRVEPKAGRLILFPSTMWHCTLPFDAGERLTVAFDVRAPRSAPERQ
jgi:tetratricopeptide (TPR) repeat protein